MVRFNKELIYGITGSLVVILSSLRFFYGVWFFGGGDLGISLECPEKYLEVTRYSWNYLEELGSPVNNSFELPVFYIYTLLKSLFGSMATYLTFSMVPWLGAFLLIYIGLNKFGNPFASFLSALIYVLGPATAQKYLSVPIVSTYATILLGGVIIYSICEVLSSENISLKRLLAPSLLTSPFYLPAFTNPYFAFGAILPLLLLDSYLVSRLMLVRIGIFSKLNEKEALRVIIKAAIITSIFVSLLAIYHLISLLTLSESVLKKLPSDPQYILKYARAESSVIPIYTHFLNVKEIYVEYYPRIILSLIILFIAFYPMLRRRWNHLKGFYLVFTSFYILSILLEKGVKEPFAFINEAFYVLFAPYSFGFRAPFQKFGSSTIICFTFLFYVGIVHLSNRLDLKYIFKARGRRIGKAMTSTLIILISVYLIFDPVVSGKTIRESWMQQERNYIALHFEKLRTLLSGEIDGRILLLPLSYGVWSDYELDGNPSNGFEYIGTNEGWMLGIPVLTKYSWGQNNYLKKLISEMKYATLDAEGIKELMKLGNIKYVVFDYKKFDHYGVFEQANQFELIKTLERALSSEIIVDNISNGFEIYRINDKTSYFYSVQETEDEIVDVIRAITESEANLSPFTPQTTCAYRNQAIKISLDSDGYERREARFFIEFYTPLNLKRIPEIKLSLESDNPDVIEAIYVAISAPHLVKGYLQWVAIPPSQDFNLQLMKGNFTKTALGNITRIDIAIWVKKGVVGNFTFNIRELKISTKEPLRMQALDDYRRVTPDVWELHLNSSSPIQVVFSQRYDPNWKIYVYSEDTGELLEVISMNPFYDSIFNSFRIKHEGMLKVILKYEMSDVINIQNRILVLEILICFATMISEPLLKRFEVKRGKK